MLASFSTWSPEIPVLATALPQPALRHVTSLSYSGHQSLHLYNEAGDPNSMGCSCLGLKNSKIWLSLHMWKSPKLVLGNKCLFHCQFMKEKKVTSKDLGRVGDPRMKSWNRLNFRIWVSQIRKAEFQNMGVKGRSEINPSLFVLQMRKPRLRVGCYYQGPKGVSGKAEPPDPERKRSHRTWLPSPHPHPGVKEFGPRGFHGVSQWKCDSPTGRAGAVSLHSGHLWLCGPVPPPVKWGLTALM